MQWLSYPLYADLPHSFWLIFVFIGAAIGSFYNVLALRWGHVRLAKLIDNAHPLLHLMAGRSHCPCCHQKIPLYHNIPLVSWILLRGKSACCKESISPIYLAFEVLGALVFLFIALTIGPTVVGLVVATLLMTLALTIRLYLREGFVPAGLMTTLAVLGALYAMSPQAERMDESLLWPTIMMGAAAIFAATKPGKLVPVQTHDIALLSISGLILGPWALPMCAAALLWIAIGKIFLAKTSIIQKYDFTVGVGVSALATLGLLMIIAGTKP